MKMMFVILDGNYRFIQNTNELILVLQNLIQILDISIQLTKIIVNQYFRKKKIILGGGPNRIGQGIEFDYCCVHASFAISKLGYESIMIIVTLKLFLLTMIHLINYILSQLL